MNERSMMNLIEIICMVIGAVATILGGVWLILSKVFKMGQTSGRIDNIEKTMTKLESLVDRLPCNIHHDDITKIKTVLVEKYPKSSSVFSMKSSPRKLNETGEKLYAAINGEQFLKENKETLFNYISDNSPLVALDVEQLANSACLSLVPTAAFNSMKNYVYNEPTWTLPNGNQYDITINDVCFVLGLQLRDMYLSEHPEISKN
ncbi:MAG: hypothetical protein ACI4TR_00760 [Bacteroidaceae bacterium]